MQRTAEGGLERVGDPTLFADELTPVLGYQPPDDFGMKLTPTTDVQALFEGR